MIFFLTLTLGLAQAEARPELDYLVGEFRADVELFDREGALTRRSRSETRVVRIFNGRALEQRGELAGSGLEARSFYYVDPVTKEVRWDALSSTLKLHRFTGGLEHGALTLVAEDRASDGRPRRYKRVDSDVSEEGYTFSMYVAEPGDEEWILINRQFNRRLGRGAVAAERLRSYAGVWMGEEHRETPAGEGFRFRYALEPLDEAGTIYEMTITQEMDDGTSRLSFTGFKHYDARAEEVHYVGFSPSGRVGRGRVVVVGDTLETAYEGRGPDGTVMDMRDVFTRIEKARFRSVTYVRRAGADSWETLNEDHWRRAAP